MKNREALGLVIVGLIAGLALGSLGIASAASSAAQSTATSSTAATTTGQPGPGGRGGPGGPGSGVIGTPGFGGEGDLSEALAALSGLTVDEINTQRASGKSFADIAKTEGVSEAKLIAETVKIETAECDAGVNTGQITAAERTKVLADIESRLKTAIADTSAPCGPGGPNGPAGSGTSTSSSTVTQ